MEDFESNASEIAALGFGSSRGSAQGADGKNGGGGANDLNGSKKSKSKSGGFESLGLSKEVFSGVKKMGYKVPTPIQRKCLPSALAGKDLVAMARTGSGKTACFLIPMLQKLAAHSPTRGARGLILSPTRELAQQTYKFAIKLGRFTTLRVCLLQGGDSLRAQFEALSNNPDILVSTPGRLVHLLAEVRDLSLKRTEVLVVDEADRLFEMGFALQLKEIWNKLPEQRQTVLFSATMPSKLMEFTRAGLHDPDFIRLDTEKKVSENLKLAFFCIRSKEKLAALIYLLTEVIPKDDLTIIFAATKFHVQMISEIISLATEKICSVAFGSMDAASRKENLEEFRKGKNRFLVVTDVAARGLDIPLLNNVINFDFPANPKLFVHRVGRAARQERSGTAYSFLCQDELPYAVDLHLFLGRSVKGFSESEEDVCYDVEKMTPNDVHFGRFPQPILDFEVERLEGLTRNNSELDKLSKSLKNAYSLYVKTRTDASKSSIKRAKELGTQPRIHPLLISGSSRAAMMKYDEHLKALRGFRPGSTIFELENMKNGKKKSEQAIIMCEKRSTDQSTILKTKEEASAKELALKRAEELEANIAAQGDDSVLGLKSTKKLKNENGEAVVVENEEENERPARARISKAARRKAKKLGISFSDAAAATAASQESTSFACAEKDTFIETKPAGYNPDAEAHMSIYKERKGDQPTQASRLQDALLDLTPDDQEDIMFRQRTYHWDKRKKKYVKASMDEHMKAKRVKNDSGTMVRVKNHGELYDKWKHQARKISGGEGRVEVEDDEEAAPVPDKLRTNVRHLVHSGRKLKQLPNKGKNVEVKNEDQLRKERKLKEKNRIKNLPKQVRASVLGEKRKPTIVPKRGKGEPGTSRFTKTRAIVKEKGNNNKKKRKRN